jgi:hypothetical protein
MPKHTPIILDNWPRDKKNPHRFLCTKARPMPKGMGGQWTHMEARETGSCSNDCHAYYECRACGHTWSAELPE